MALDFMELQIRIKNLKQYINNILQGIQDIQTLSDYVVTHDYDFNTNEFIAKNSLTIQNILKQIRSNYTYKNNVYAFSILKDVFFSETNNWIANNCSVNYVSLSDQDTVYFINTIGIDVTKIVSKNPVKKAVITGKSNDATFRYENSNITGISPKYIVNEAWVKVQGVWKQLSDVPQLVTTFDNNKTLFKIKVGNNTIELFYPTAYISSPYNAYTGG